MTDAPLANPPLVAALWPGKTPGDVGIAEPEKVWIHESKILGGPTRLITNVSTPTITVYRPAKEMNTGTAMVICPGGGYWDLFWELEGEEVAAWLTSIGITGIILKFRVPRRPGDPGYGESSPPPPPGPVLDAQRAVSMVRSRASEWGIDPKKIGIVGFSAGGHLALMTAFSFEKRKYERIDAIDDVSCRPDFAISCYSGYYKAKDKDELSPSISIPAGAPPILLAQTTDDSICSPEHAAFMYLALKRAGIPAELHIYANGDHDFGVRENGKLPSSWMQLCLNWMRHYGVLNPL